MMTVNANYYHFSMAITTKAALTVSLPLKVVSSSSATMTALIALTAESALLAVPNNA